MKRNLIAVSILLMVGNAVFPNDSTVNSALRQALEREYPGAISPHWQKADDYQRVSFGFNGHLIVAYFNEDAELLGSARSLFFSELPLQVMKSMETLFAESMYVEILEIANREGTRYNLTVEKEDKRFFIKLDSEGGIVSIVKKKVQIQSK